MATMRWDQLKPGMILDADVQDLNGRTLLRAGAGITEKHLKIFRAWGITEAAIRVAGEGAEEAAPGGAQIDPARYATAEAEMLEIFRNTDIRQAPVKELLRLAIQRQAQQPEG